MTIQLKTNRQIATYCWLDIEFRTYRRFLDETNKISFEIQLCLALKNFLSLFFQVLNSSWSEFYCHAKIMVRWRLCQNKSISTNFPRFSFDTIPWNFDFCFDKNNSLSEFFGWISCSMNLFTLWNHNGFGLALLVSFSWKVNWRNENNYVLLFAICPWIFYWCFS